jgi:hypothetical protein
MLCTDWRHFCYVLGKIVIITYIFTLLLWGIWFTHVKINYRVAHQFYHANIKFVLLLFLILTIIPYMRKEVHSLFRILKPWKLVYILSYFVCNLLFSRLGDYLISRWWIWAFNFHEHLLSAFLKVGFIKVELHITHVLIWEILINLFKLFIVEKSNLEFPSENWQFDNKGINAFVIFEIHLIVCFLVFREVLIKSLFHFKDMSCFLDKLAFEGVDRLCTANNIDCNAKFPFEIILGQKNGFSISPYMQTFIIMFIDGWLLLKSSVSQYFKIVTLCSWCLRFKDNSNLLVFCTLGKLYVKQLGWV